MSTATIREPAGFGKRSEPHQIIVVHKGKTRHFNISPIWAMVLTCTLFMFLFGYFAATTYLVFRDDLISSSFAKQARMQHEYEDRIAALRSKLDRVTSRQLLDQQAIESQVRELMARQQMIGGRDGSMKHLMDQAKRRGIAATPTSGSVPIPASRPSPDQRADAGRPQIDTTRTGSVKGSAFARSSHANAQSTDAQTDFVATNSFTRELFGDVAQAITIIDTRQREEIDAIRITAAKKTQRIGEVLKSVGYRAPRIETDAVGGPFLPLDHSVDFATHLQALEETLKAYDKASGMVKALPLGNPVPGAQISSRYGSRTDPFNGRTAFHAGIDFRAKTGTPVRSAGDGKVVRASRKGGYGKVVEVKHPNGMITRYAHLSRYSVKVGQRVKKGEMIGKVGSTGRSTGPHLHYEIRKSNDKATNPASYISAGRKLNGLL